MAILQRENVDIHYQVVGEGPLVFFCHGLITGNIASWYFSVAKDLAASHRLVMFDMRSHGKSSLVDHGFDLPTLASDLHALIGELNTDSKQPVHLVGHSYGALVAMEYAMQHQHELKSLSIIDAPIPASKIVYPSLARLKDQENLEHFIKTECLQHGIAGKRKLAKVAERLSYLVNQSTLLDDLKNCHEFPSERLNALTLPAMLLYGAESPCIATGRDLANILPNAELTLLPCGHYIPNELPNEMSLALKEFLGKQA